MLNATKNELVARGKRGDETAVQAIRSAIERTFSNNQDYFTYLLGRIATDDALRSLLDIVDTSGQNKRLHNAALEAIANIGRHYDQKIPPQALSSLLEEYFDTIPKDNLQLLDPIANGLSTLGMATGIEKLLRFIETAEIEGNLTPEFVNSMTDALREIRNFDAIGPLRARLQQDKEIKREATRMAGEALASIGHAKATEALLEWASQVKGREHIQQARAWLSQIQDDDSYQMLLHAQEYYRFRDSKMPKMISGLALELDPKRAQQRTIEIEEAE
jgi:hypothetical protein